MTTKELLSRHFSELTFLKVVDEKERGRTLFDVTIIFPHTQKLSEEQKEEITNKIKEDHKDKDVKVIFKKSFLDDATLASNVLEFLNKEFFVMCEMFQLQNATFDDDNNLVCFDFVCDNAIKDYVEKNQVADKILNYLENNYHYTFKISTKFCELDPEEETKEERVLEIEDTSYFKPREIIVHDVQKLLGEPIKMNPMYIKDIKIARETICICGTVKNFSELMTKERVDDKGKTRPPKPYFRWQMEDFTGNINVLSFCSETNLPKIRKIADGSKLVMVGDAVEDNFTTGFIFRPKHISFCELPEQFEEVINYRRALDHYKVVNVEPAQVINQMDFFNFQGRTYPEYIKTHTIVVYDFETSGLSSANDDVIEIGAVKIVNGEYREQFQSFININKPLPKEITELTTITDEDLKDAPCANDVFTDFYKFCEGAVLCGYNSDNFDLHFLKRFWKEFGFKFDHETLDCYKVATSVIKGLKKYTLSAMAEHLKVKLYNAHRALADATATAEILLTVANDALKDKK